MKKFSEFVAEAKAVKDAGDHHAEAAKIVKKHDKHAEDVYKSGGEHPDGHKLHLAGVHHSKVAKLHADLEKAGFKKHEGSHAPEHGASSGGGGDGKVYHKFTKGKTSVNVSHKPIVAGFHDHHQHQFDHHFVEVHSTVKHPLSEEVLDESMSRDEHMAKSEHHEVQAEHHFMKAHQHASAIASDLQAAGHKSATADKVAHTHDESAPKYRKLSGKAQAAAQAHPLYDKVVHHKTEEKKHNALFNDHFQKARSKS
jgi:hypothetical protein